jgi:hypothetical protein
MMGTSFAVMFGPTLGGWFYEIGASGCRSSLWP